MTDEDSGPATRPPSHSSTSFANLTRSGVTRLPDDVKTSAKSTSRASTRSPRKRLSRWRSRARWYWRNLGLRLGQRLSTVLRDDHALLIVLAAGIGVISGSAAGLLLWWIEYAIEAFPHGGSDPTIRWAVLLLVPSLGGLATGFIRWIGDHWMRTNPSIGVPTVITAVSLHGGRVQARGGLLTGLGTGFTIGSGGSCGHEGPSVAIGAAVGSSLARFFGLGRRRHMTLVGAGCAGGLAAAFNAPLAGVIFTLEIVFSGAVGGNVGTMSVFVPLIVAAVMGTFTSHFIRGDETAFDLPSHGSVAPHELVWFLAMAVVAALLGSLISRVIFDTESRFKALSIPSWIKPALGGLLVGLVAAVSSNEILGPGHDTIEEAVHGTLFWDKALLLLALKLVVTAITLGSGGIGGAFLPSLYIGACLGAAVGSLSAFALGDASNVGGYALVGMGAIFAAMMHAPLTPIIMLFELTHDYGMILPLMLTCILAVVIARRVNPLSFYQMVLVHRGVVPHGEHENDTLKRVLVRELVRDPITCINEDASLDELHDLTVNSGEDTLFVLDADQAVVGYVDHAELAEALLDPQPGTSQTEKLIKRNLSLLYPQDSVAGAMFAFARSGLDILPVVDRSHRLAGVLRLRDVLTHYSEQILTKDQEVLAVHTDDHPDQEVALGRGLILERLMIDPTWAGHTLAQLNLRGETGVSVLEWSREDHLIPIDPCRPLREGDVLAMCGTRAQLLATRELHPQSPTTMPP